MSSFDALPPGSTSAAPQAAAKPARSGRWSRILGGVVALIALVRLGTFAVGWFHPAMPACDATRIRDTIDDIYKDKAKAGVKDFTDVQTLSHSDDGAVCSARIALASGDKGSITYSLHRDGRSILVHIDKATDD